MLSQSKAYPLLLAPAYQDYLWGGKQIIELFKRPVQLLNCAESWEVSDREEGLSYIRNGPLKGISLKNLIEKYPSFLGIENKAQFPLLIKLIDAAKSLSIQVHPCEEGAKRLGGEPKSEMWHILEAKKGSQIYLGLKENLSKQDILCAIEKEEIEKYMNAIHVRAGETYFIPAGLIHSIGKGCLIYEVQQNSNTTYRLYDWGRLDKDGNKRELQIEKALNVMSENQLYKMKGLQKDLITPKKENRYSSLLDTPYFEFNSLTLESTFEVTQTPFCKHYFVKSGEAKIETEIESLTLKKGESLLVPAVIDPFIISPITDSVTLLETIPKKQD